MSNSDTQAQRQKNILDEAQEIIYGDREKTYGDPSKNLRNIADFWATYLNAKNVKLRDENIFLGIDIDDVCQMMILVKQARLINDPSHRDSKVDICGYAALSDRCTPQKIKVDNLSGQGYTPSPSPKPQVAAQENQLNPKKSFEGKPLYHGDVVNCYWDNIEEKFVPLARIKYS